MNIHIITLGCKVNLYESENIKQNFISHGYTVSKSETEADIFIVNSCTVTGNSDKKLKKELRRLRREYPSSVIVLTGCFPQAFSEEAKKLDADIITGTKNRNLLPKLVSEFLSTYIKTCHVSEYARNEKFELMTNVGYENNTRAFVKIQDGCNMFCTYCIIPYSRGNFRSKPIMDIIYEVKQLAEAGYKEIVLVGINLSFYGIDFGKRLIDAVEAVCKVDGIERVRLGSIEPEIITEDDILRLANLKKLCPQFHLSLQSGCDKTLKAMNRRYNTTEYKRIVDLLRKSFYNVAITTDIMVGFPGETDEDFEQSLNFIQKIGFSKSHVFPYSPRKGTIAAEFDNQIPENIKNIRTAQMIELTNESTQKFLESQLGKEFPVLFEREKTDGIHHGFTPNYTHVKILTKNSDKSLRNQLFYVKIIELGKDCCIGEILS